MNIGKAIKTCREARGLSQKELALIAKITPAYICQIESGDKKPKLDVVSDIANAIGVTTALLFLVAADEGELEDLSAELAKEMIDLMLSSLKEMTIKSKSIESKAKSNVKSHVVTKSIKPQGKAGKKNQKLMCA